MHKRELSSIRRLRLAWVTLTAIVAFALPAHAQTSTVDILKRSSVSWEKHPVEGLGVRSVTLNIDLILKGANRRSPASISHVIKYLTDLRNYSFVADWPSDTAAAPFVGANPVFRPTGLSMYEVDDDTATMDNRSYQIRLQGFLLPRTRGEIHLKLPSAPALMTDWTFQRFDGVTSDPIILFYSEGADWEKLPSYSGKVAFGFDGDTPTLDFTGDGYLDSSDTGTRSLTLRAKIPLRTPKDVRDTPGANRDASVDVPDAVDLSYNQLKYRKGGSLLRTGFKLRTTGSLRGLEAVGYYSPFMGWYNGARGFYAMELELGYRKGDAEFQNLTTRAADTGNVVARLGSVVEWAPQIGSVNRHLGKGLRFFVRGRGWLDTYKNGSGDTSLRFRPFGDSELFWNFSENSRIYLRGEYGYLPPDLSGKSSRASIGVGTAF
jgi:hypothetical protein